MTEEANLIRDFLVCREDCSAWGNPRMICDCGCGRAKAALAVLESRSGWTSAQQDEINRLRKNNHEAELEAVVDEFHYQ